jgi:O-antigen/teichoic acid export membrane protein
MRLFERLPDLRRGAGLALDVGLLAGMRMIAIAIGLVYVKVYTNRLDPEALGVFFYLATLSYLLNALLFVPFDFYIQAYCAKMGERLPLKSITRMTGGVLFAALGLVVAVGGLLVLLGQLAWLDVASLYAVAVLLFGCTSLRNLLNNRGHRRVVATALVGEAVGRVTAFLVLVLILAPSGRLLFASAAIALLLEFIALIAYAAQRLPWGPSDNASASAPIVATTAPVSVSAACNLVQMQAYRTLYPWAGAPTSAAVFAVVANVGSAGMAAAGQVFSQILLPRVYGSGGTYARHYIAWAALLTLVIAIVAWIAAPVLVALITSPRYSAHAGLMVFGVLMEGANVIVAAITVGSMLKDDTRRLMAWNVAGAVTGATGYAVALIKAPASPTAIGLALVLSQAVVLGGLALDARRRAQ